MTGCAVLLVLAGIKKANAIHAMSPTEILLANKLGAEVSDSVSVDYESPTTIIISGHLLNTDTAIFNNWLWEAMDVLKGNGWKMQQVMTSGVGSVGNPTTVYVLMTK